MDCRRFKDSIDSYLCGELMVETNLEMLRHIEHCETCRHELAARRNISEVLKRAGRRETLSDEAKARLITRLRAESRIGLWSRWVETVRQFSGRTVVLAATFSLALIAAISYSAFLFSSNTAYASALNDQMLNNVAREHVLCREEFTERDQERLLKSAAEISPAFETVKKSLAISGIEIRTTHECDLEGRRFIHLGFARGEQLVSLLVTERNRDAMKSGIIPTDDGLREGLQRSVQNEYQVAAYQSSKYIVLVVSQLPALENDALASRLGEPVCNAIRDLEAKSPGGVVLFK